MAPSRPPDTPAPPAPAAGGEPLPDPWIEDVAAVVDHAARAAGLELADHQRPGVIAQYSRASRLARLVLEAPLPEARGADPGTDALP
ncbi:MAG: DUF4089 domain-containing protein [Azospirillaceae bacterium]